MFNEVAELSRFYDLIALALVSEDAIGPDPNKVIFFQEPEIDLVPVVVVL